jgi:XRE family aerobic/anaerobic benzoate catabolism transcriptional regulator
MHTILTDLAMRVRRLREQRRWSRAELAERSGLSVRFLARIESGEGNVSVLRLAELATALGTTADVLVRREAVRGRIVTLVGMRGAGKSTVGPILARDLGVPFVEVESAIFEASGLPLDQLFELHGEAYYRRLERETLARIVAGGGPTVVAAAGGVVNDPETWRMLLDASTVVWLHARPEDHWGRVIAQGDRRPMADNPDAMAELRAMLAAREPLYRQSHVAVDTSGRTPEEVARAIASRLDAAD